MNVAARLSERASRHGFSPISYLMEQGVANPGILSLAAGLVDQESLPVAEVQRAVAGLLADPERGRRALQYGTTDGDGEFRRLIIDHLAALDGRLPGDLGLMPERVIVGTGSQQLLYLVGEILLDPGDIVLVGVPSYFVYMGALESLGARIVPLATDEHGIVPEALDDTLEGLESHGDLERVKFLYDVTYFNNPTGLSLSAERKRALVEAARRWSRRQRIFVVEDAAYRELRYRGEDIPSLLAWDQEGDMVVYAGTFSKPFAPGLKTGYAVVPTALRAALIQQKGHHDFGTSNFNQQLLAQAITTGEYHRHLAELRRIYRAKLEASLDALARELAGQSGQVRWTKPDGGLYVWVRLPPEIRTATDSEFMARCLEAGVLVVPGEFCFPSSMPDVPRNYFRLSFGVQPVAGIREGVRRLAGVIRSLI